MPRQILIIEDERPIRESVEYALRREGWKVLSARDGETGLSLARTEKPDLIILDLMLPGMDGLDVCRAIRQESAVPIIMLTAKSEEVDKVIGLEVGADDYVTKPFGVRELVARVKACMRRLSPVYHSDQPISIGDLRIDTSAHEVEVRGKSVDLAPREFQLLRLLASHPGRALSREQILEAVWGEDAFCDPHTVDVHIRWLREKIEQNPSRPRHLLTVRGVGYRFARVDELTAADARKPSLPTRGRERK